MSAPLHSLRRTPFRVGPFAIEPQRNAVAGPEGECLIEPKVMDVLCVLTDRPGEVFSRNELIDRVWGVEFGGDESLTRAVSQLRKAFAGAKNDAQLIETIPKRGYRLVAPVSFDVPPAIDTAPPALPPLPRVRFQPRLPRWLAMGGGVAALMLLTLLVWLFRPQPSFQPAPNVRPAVEGISVAVQGFASLDPASASTSRALTDDLAASLSRAKLLRVGSGQAGEGTRLRYAVDGSVQQSGGRVRVNVQITDVNSGVRVWTQEYERAYDGSLAARNALSSTVSAEVYPQLVLAAQAALKRRPVLTLAPWELVLLATWTPGGTQVFLAPHKTDRDWLQRRALALDPKYAPAHASLAQFLAYTALFNPDWDGAALHQEIAAHAALATAHGAFRCRCPLPGGHLRPPRRRAA